MQKTEKQISSSEALSKLAALCSRSEQCTQNCLDKLAKWQISEEESQKIILRLTEEKYVDDRRYALFFTKDKHQLAHWGKAKIANALRLKKIPQAFIDEALSEIKDDKYNEQLKSILLQKMKSVKAKNNFDLKSKLFRFAAGRGFEGDKVLKAIDPLIKEYSTLKDDDNEFYI